MCPSLAIRKAAELLIYQPRLQLGGAGTTDTNRRGFGPRGREPLTSRELNVLFHVSCQLGAFLFRQHHFQSSDLRHGGTRLTIQSCGCVLMTEYATTPRHTKQ